VGVLPQLLPQLEQDALQEMIGIRLNVRQLDTPWWMNTSTWTAAHARVPTFLCPSDTAWERNEYVFAFTSQFVSSVTGLPTYGAFALPGDTRGIGRTNYIGVAGFKPR
jgi:hypothetical protein